MTIHKTLATDARTQKVGDPLTNSRGSREVRLRMRPISLRSLVAGTLIALLLSGLTLLFGSGSHASAMAEHSADGYVYVLNNNLIGSNSITVFSREEDGSVTLSGTTSIGGMGSVAAFADGTQGSLIITHDEEHGCLPQMPEATRFPSSTSITGISPWRASFLPAGLVPSA